MHDSRVKSHLIIYYRDILLNYALVHPSIGYIQGMSDLLAPLLCTLHDESLAYWCFTNLMEQTLFCATARATAATNANAMETQLEWLRELIRMLEPRIYAYFRSLQGDALELMFVHRWLLLLFKVNMQI